MTMSEITNRLKYDISNALKRVAGGLSFRKEGQGDPSSAASNRSGLKRQAKASWCSPERPTSATEL